MNDFIDSPNKKKPKYYFSFFSIFLFVIGIIFFLKLQDVYFTFNPTKNQELYGYIFLILVFSILILFLVINHLHNVIKVIDKAYNDLKIKDKERIMPYEFALNSSVDAIYWFTLDAKFIYVNDAACNMLGYTKEELIGQPLEIMDPNFSRESAIDMMERIKNTPKWLFETTQKKSNGEIFPVEVSGHGFSYLENEYICAFGRDITQRVESNNKITAMNIELQKSLDEKGILLKEVHHRVKNNMEIISSLLSMQLRRAKDNEVKYILKQSKSRISTMALVHEFLYLGENLAHINLKNYIKRLIEDIKELYISNNTKLDFDLNIEPLIFSTNRCIQIGMLIHELSVNSLKYAFKENKNNLLCIHINRFNKNIHIKIRDNGEGLKNINSLYKTDSIGMQLIHLIVEDQLDGTIEFRNNRGLECNIIFPNDEE